MTTIASIRALAAHGSWRLDQAERVLQLASLLRVIGAHPVLRDTLALKGGTALNLLDDDLPRLSVDLDFNYLGDETGDEMTARRAELHRALEEVGTRAGLAATLVRTAHGGSTWRFAYRGVVRSGVVEVDLNLLHRIPLLPPRRVDSVVSVSGRPLAEGVLAVSRAELRAGKLLALLDRTHPRDAWDARLLTCPESPGVDDRRCWIAYLAGARRPWRELLDRPITLDPDEVERLLVPLLRGRPADLGDLAAFARHVSVAAEQAVAPLRTPSADEAAFLDAIALEGRIDPTLLGLDHEHPMHDAIARSPVLAWKAQHARAHADG